MQKCAFEQQKFALTFALFEQQMQMQKFAFAFALLFALFEQQMQMQMQKFAFAIAFALVVFLIQNLQHKQRSLVVQSDEDDKMWEKM